jgi:hypothetical protein
MPLYSSILIIFSCLASEALAFYFLSQFGLGITFLLTHVLAVLFFVLYLYRRGQGQLWRDKNLPMVFFGLLLFTFFPGVGLLGMAILFGYLRFFRSLKGKGLFEEYEKYISDQKDGSSRVENALNVLRQFRFEVGFEPFVDILLGDKVTFKASVIRKLSEQITPGNIQLLQMALKDPNAEIRLYAAGAIMKIETRLNEQIRKATERIKVTGTFREYAELGDLYRFYAVLSRSGGVLSEYYIRQSAQAYQKSLDINTNQPQTISYYCRTLIELGDLEKARNLIDRAARIWPENSDIVFLCSEVYFQQGDFEQMVKRFSKMSLLGLDEAKKRVVDFWFSSPQPSNS